MYDAGPTPPRSPYADEPRERGSSAGAWAAAALVLALGALVFAVLSHLRITELEDRVASLEEERGGLSDTTSAASPPPPTFVTTSPEAFGQPPDPDAARSDVVAAFSAVYDPNVGVETRLQLVDDVTGVAAAIRQAAAGPNGAVVATVTASVIDVQFLSPTRARVGYSLIVPGREPLSGRVGEARVAAGAWKVTRSTVCTDLLVVGGACG